MLTLQVALFANWKYEGLRSHTHLKGLAMAPYKLPCAVFIDQKTARKTSFLMIHSIILYGKELTRHEAAIFQSLSIDTHRPSV